MSHFAMRRGSAADSVLTALAQRAFWLAPTVRTRVSRMLSILVGVEYEYDDTGIPAPDRMHCFIDRRIAPGYIGWLVAGVGITQIGLARRAGQAWSPEKAMAAFLDKIATVADFRGVRPRSVRAGLIPCGGVVNPVAVPRALLVGDAAGLVSPLTAGGIHTALKHGVAAGHAIADFLSGKAADPSESFINSYPKFKTKRMLRFMFDHLQSDLCCNLLLATKPMRAMASIVYFHRRGVFDGSIESDGNASDSAGFIKDQTDY